MRVRMVHLDDKNTDYFSLHQIKDGTDSNRSELKRKAVFLKMLIANELTSLVTLFTESAEALVIATVPTENTVIAESTPAMILVFIVLVFFIFLSPFSEFLFVLLLLRVESLFIIVMVISPFLKI